MNDPCNVAFNNSNYSFTLDDFKIFENCSSDFSFRVRDKTIERVFQFLFYFVASIGNCLLLFVLYKDPLKRFRNATSYFIINLTLADLLSTASGITDTAIQLNHPRTGRIQEKQQIALCIDGIGIQCSLLMIMVFSLDRYMAIVHAYSYNNIVKKKCIVVTATILPWCFAVITLPVLYFASLSDDVHELLTRMLAGNFIALSFVTLSVHPYTHWVFLRRVKDLRNSSSNHKQLMEENLKIAKVLATTVLVVSICIIIFIIPYFVAFCFNVAKCDKCFLNHTFQSFWQYYPLLSSIRVAINSIIYAWRLPLYRKSLKALLITNGIGNRINNLHFHFNAMNCSKESVDNKTKSTKDEDQCTCDNRTVKPSSPNNSALQNMPSLCNSGYDQTETQN